MSTINSSIVEKNRKLLSALNPRHFEIILFPTEQCNFRCSYCYEDFSIGKMSELTINSIKKLIANKIGSIDSFGLNWFGGEPLLAQDIIFNISEFSKEICHKNDVIFLPGNITTNAYLLNLSLLQKLIKLNQSHFQISLDGYGETHDKTRQLLSGRGSFKRVWNNLVVMKQSDENFSASLRLHLTHDNHESISVLIKKINELILPDPRFDVFFKAIGNWGGPNSKNISVLKKEIADSIIERNKSQFSKSYYEEKVSDLQICYASKPNILTIRANGTIGKCTVALNDPRNNIGHINDNGTLTIDNEKLSPWFRGFKDNDLKILGCPMHNFPEQPKKEQIIHFVETTAL